MSEELKSERVQLLMAPSELKAIDDWSFSNRIRSRGEAIRRLIERGLAASAPPSAKPATSGKPRKKSAT